MLNLGHDMGGIIDLLLHVSLMLSTLRLSQWHGHLLTGPNWIINWKLFCVCEESIKKSVLHVLEELVEFLHKYGLENYLHP